jgi:phage terminase large subunit-like protein
MPDYSEIANQYAHDVVDGKIPSCRWVRLACQRHLTDLESSQHSEYPYTFDAAKVEHVCKFISLLKHVRGKWAKHSESIKLEPWQVFILGSIFGWVEKNTGLRRFREALVMVPRKNAKSTLAAGIGLFMLCCDGEAGAEILNGATSLAQSMEVWRTAKQMCDRSPEMTAALGIQVNAMSLIHNPSGSRFVPVIGRPPDGASPSCGIGDEAHEWITPDLYDTFKTGMMAREQPLLFIISTAGVNLASPCYALQDQAQKVLEGFVEDPRLFTIIYTIDAGTDWTTETALRMANPNYGISVDPKTLRHDQQIAISNSGKMNVWKCKHLNLWSSVKSGWMSMEAWLRCADTALNEENFKGQECIVSLDLANKIDVAGQVKIFTKKVEGKDHYYVFPRFYLPEAQTQAAGNQHYQKWVADGQLIETPGNVVDYSRILDDLVEDSKAFRVVECAYDPWNATHLTQQFNTQTGVAIVEVPQTPRYLSEPMKQLEALVLDGRIHHDGNQAMAWMMSNVVALEDKNGNLLPQKGADRSAKIDSAAALITGLSRVLARPAVQAYQPMVFI